MNTTSNGTSRVTDFRATQHPLWALDAAVAALRSSGLWFTGKLRKLAARCLKFNSAM